MSARNKIREIAERAHPVFVSENWHWSGLAPGMRGESGVPTVDAVEAMLERLHANLRQDIRDDPKLVNRGFYTTASGRLRMTYEDQDDGCGPEIVVSLELGHL